MRADSRRILWIAAVGCVAIGMGTLGASTLRQDGPAVARDDSPSRPSRSIRDHVGLGKPRQARGVAASEEASIEMELSKSRIGALTVDVLLETVASSAEDGHVSDHARFLWQATELLRVDPVACERLRTLYLDETAPSGRRALIADLLAQAGSSEAQVVLVSLLGHPLTRKDPEALLLFQRLSLIRSPSRDTLLAARGLYVRAKDSERVALAYSLGALLGNAEPSLDPVLRGQLHDELRDEWIWAPSERRVDALASLGNARDRRDLPVFAQALEAPNAQERLEAVRAIGRQSHEPGARRLLMETLAHEDSAVVAEAVLALGARPLSSAELARLAALPHAKVLSAEVAEALTNVLGRQSDSMHHKELVAALDALGAQATGSSRVQTEGLRVYASLMDEVRR